MDRDGSRGLDLKSGIEVALFAAGGPTTDDTTQNTSEVAVSGRTENAANVAVLGMATSSGYEVATRLLCWGGGRGAL